MPPQQKDFLAEMDVLSAEMERFFYRVFHPKLAVKTFGEPSWQPPTDIYETEDCFVVKLELAGVGKEDVKVELEEERLCVRGVRRHQPAGNIKAYHRVEINYGRFERVILLRAAVSRDEISACFENGLLTVTIPKVHPGERVRRIEVVPEKE